MPPELLNSLPTSINDAIIYLQQLHNDIFVIACSVYPKARDILVSIWTDVTIWT